MTVQPSDSILIVDFGSQVTQLIARRVREAGVYSEIAPFNSAAAAFARMQPKGIIMSGGPASVLDLDGPRIPAEILESGLPIMAICYGQQALMHQLGGEVLLGDSGDVDVSWDVQGDGAFAFRWLETGGPPVSVPIANGFGSVVTTTLIERSLGELSPFSTKKRV